jgi:RNA-directed DNA polymerase
MKRIGNLYHQICSIENLMLADENAQKGKKHQAGVIEHNANRADNIFMLHKHLVDKTFRTSPYSTFTVFEPKERLVFKLPYYPDRIVHHAILNVLEPVFVSVFTADTYSCIKGRGIHSAARKLKANLKDTAATQFCLKLDIKKFYPSVDHDTLKMLLRRKIKDLDLLQMLYEIIDSATGLPIGNYLSQYFANFYLSYFDHWIKEKMGIRYYFRYADDMVILLNNKPDLHSLLFEIKHYLSKNLKLEVKNNYQIFPVEKRGIDFVGYKFYHTHTMLRKGIKRSFARKVSRGANKATIASYKGWAKHANTKNLVKKILNEGV